MAEFLYLRRDLLEEMAESRSFQGDPRAVRIFYLVMTLVVMMVFSPAVVVSEVARYVTGSAEDEE